MINLLRNMIIGCFCVAVALPPATAAEMSLKQVIGTVLAHHPDLKVSRIDSAIAATETTRLQGLLDPTVSATASVSDEKIPTISDFQPS